MLTHHKLKVYQKALAMAASASGLSATWERRPALVDHFRRASESVVLNIAEGATSIVLNVAEGNGRHSQSDQQRFLEMAAASAVKTAAYLDLLQATRPAEVETAPGREFLSRIVAMLDRF